MSKRIEQSRRHGHYDPRYLVVELHDLRAAPTTSPRGTAIGHGSPGLVPRTPLRTAEGVEL
jgi:hypothetical protein